MEAAKDKMNELPQLGRLQNAPERQQMAYRHWFSFTRNPQRCSLWLVNFVMLTLLVCICPAQADLSFPVPTSSKVMSILYPTHSCSSTQRTLYLYVLVGKLCSTFLLSSFYFYFCGLNSVL